MTKQFFQQRQVALSGPAAPAEHVDLTRRLAAGRTEKRQPDPDWLNDRLAEARAVIADVAHHSDHLIRLACSVLARHGESEAERRDARALQLVIDARSHPRHTQHHRADDCNDESDHEVDGQASPRGQGARAGVRS